MGQRPTLLLHPQELPQGQRPTLLLHPQEFPQGQRPTQAEQLKQRWLKQPELPQGLKQPELPRGQRPTQARSS